MSAFRRDMNINPGPSWRVILVGRTGLDQALRRDAAFELIRARDAIDAIGELSDPIDSASPTAAAVVVSPDAEPVPSEVDSFLDALRRVNPSVRLVRVGDIAPGYDAAVARDADAAQFHAVLEQTDTNESEPNQPELNQPEPSQPEAEVIDGGPTPASFRFIEPVSTETERVSTPEPAADVRTSPHDAALSSVADRVPAGVAPADDGALARALLSGHSVLEPAMAIARLRAGRDDLHYDTSTGRLACDDHAWVNGSGAPVLASLSAWLSAWVRLDAQHKELRHAAFTDPLTGAWNRRYFDRFMDAAIEQARDARRTVTLMVFDIDNFKQYNDAFGHGAGDEILTETVRLLNAVIRPTDRVCRVGGDEFAVIFYEPEGPRDATSSPPESIHDIATRFQREICAHKFPKLGEEAAGTLTISGGLATFPWDGHNTATLLERADQLSMASKRQGKNALTFGQGAEKVCRLTDS